MPRPLATPHGTVQPFRCLPENLNGVQLRVILLQAVTTPFPKEIIMLRPSLLLVAASAIVIAGPAAAAEIQLSATGPVIELNVTENVKQKPDIATIGAGVTTRAQTAQQAMSQNAAAMNSVIGKISALGIAKDDVQTAGINVNAIYDYDSAAQKQVFRGYQASNQVTVVLRDLARMGSVLDALVAAGATDINGPNFALEDDAAQLSAARKHAVERAFAEAREYAAAAGYRGIRLIEIDEGGASPVPPRPIAFKVAQSAVAAPTPVEPGLVATSVSIEAKFELTGANNGAE